MSSEFTKETLVKAIELSEIIEKALEGKGFALDAIEPKESSVEAFSRYGGSQRKVTERVYYLRIVAISPESEENMAETSETR